MNLSRAAVVYWLSGLIGAVYLLVALASPALQAWAYANLAVDPSAFADRHRSLLDPLTPLFGHVFLHAGLLHLGMNLLVFLQVGLLPAARLEEQEPGGLKFLALFFGSAAVGGLFYVWFNPGSTVPAVGASGAVCGVFAAYLLASRRHWRTALRDRRVQMAAFWFLAINVGAAALARASGFLPIAWEAHLGGFIGGAALYPLLAPRAGARPWG